MPKSFPEVLPCAVGLCLTLTVAMDAIADCPQASGPQRVALIELFTSEGCNSCPPADFWMSRIAVENRDPLRLVPLAFHVDYWDYLGWKDRFAQAAFTQRQHLQAQRNRARMVYTPQFLLNGRDLRRANADSRLSERLSAIQAQTPGATIDLSQRPGEGHTFITMTASARVASTPTTLQGFIALTQDNLVTHVRTGENAGRQLKHDAVVRELVGPIVFDGAGRARWSGDIALDPRWPVRDLSIAAFVQNADDGDVLQAMRVALCPAT